MTDQTPPPCKTCGNPVAWAKRLRRWRTTCSVACRKAYASKCNAAFFRRPPLHSRKITEAEVAKWVEERNRP